MDTDKRKGSFPCQSKRNITVAETFPLEYFYFLLNQENRLYEESELMGGGWGWGELRS